MGFDETIYIVGAGLAGSECAYQLAQFGYRVKLFEMRDKVQTPAHRSDRLAELVCSNSLGSMTDYSASGQLKWEAQQLGSLLLDVAHRNRVPAGMALSVDRELFSGEVTQIIQSHPNIEVVRELVEDLDQLPRPTIIATGPLTESRLQHSIENHFGSEFCYFFDAIAPIIDRDSINMEIVWQGDRWDRGTKDYLNCPMNEEEFFRFTDEVARAEKVTPRDFEKTSFFEGCMPIETFVERDPVSLRFGPCSPKGLVNPRTKRWPFAVVQLRQENREATAYNMVGFQTRMTYGEQVRVFRMIPGLEEAEFLKLGSIHRNLYIHSPKVLSQDLSSKKDPLLFFAGQITGVEGYFESTSIGLLVARFLRDKLQGHPLVPPPRASAFGSLLSAITEERDYFQPTNINFGLLPFVPECGNKRIKRERQLHFAKESLKDYLGAPPAP